MPRRYSGVDDVALGLDEILAGHHPRAPQQRHIGVEDELGGLEVLGGDAVVQVVGRRGQEPG